MVEIETSGAAWHRLAGCDDVAPGEVKMFPAPGRVIALARLADGRFGALDNVCPHSGGPLGQGSLENEYLVCPWHGREFNPLTGECQGFAEKARAYTVEVRGDSVYVAL